jgi:hypothetical protein
MTHNSREDIEHSGGYMFIYLTILSMLALHCYQNLFPCYRMSTLSVEILARLDPAKVQLKDAVF